jgi:hypothetical protein
MTKNTASGAAPVRRKYQKPKVAIATLSKK